MHRKRNVVGLCANLHQYACVHEPACQILVLIATAQSHSLNIYVQLSSGTNGVLLA